VDLSVDEAVDIDRDNVDKQEEMDREAGRIPGWDTNIHI
jgi:hypothetical protein